MLGVGIWVTTQDTEYKHLAGNLVSLIFLWILRNTICGEYICDDRSSIKYTCALDMGGNQSGSHTNTTAPSPSL